MKIASMAMFAEFVHGSAPGRGRPAHAAPVESDVVAPMRTAALASSVAAALPVGADASSGGATDSGASDAERQEAVVQFTQALWQAIHEGGGDHDKRGQGQAEEHHDNGRRAHGWNRDARGYAGLVPQIERLIGRYAVEAPGTAPVDGGTEPPPAPSAASPTQAGAPAPQAAAATPVVARAAESAVSAADSAAEPEASTPPLDAEPTDRLPLPDPLMAAFSKMLEAFGVKLPPGDPGGVPLAEFLSRLVEGLRGQSRGADGCGCFLSVSA